MTDFLDGFPQSQLNGCRFFTASHGAFEELPLAPSILAKFGLEVDSGDNIAANKRALVVLMLINAGKMSAESIRRIEWKRISIHVAEVKSNKKDTPFQSCKQNRNN